MNEVELAEYCRKKVPYREQIDEWKSVCLHANGQALDQSNQLNGTLKEEQKRGKQLEERAEEREGISRSCILITFAKKTPSDLGGDEEE